jgi:hypothetical protein
MRPVSVFLLGLSLLVGSACTEVPTGTGDHESDLERLREATSETIAALGLELDFVRHEGIERCTNPVGEPGSAASVAYAIEIGGRDPTEVSRTIADYWRSRSSDWFGDNVTLDTSLLETGDTRVYLEGEGWNLAAGLPIDPQTQGRYRLGGGGPCYGEPGSFGTAIP